MIDEVDEAIRAVLIEELPIVGDEVELSFKQPKREWSSRLSRPTLNIFLYDIRENNKMRTPVPTWLHQGAEDGGSFVVESVQPTWVNLHYLITAWATEPEDEHRMLMRAMIALLRHPYLDEQFLPGGDLQDTPVTKTAEFDQMLEVEKLWSALDNEMRVGLNYKVSIPVSPLQSVTKPIVSSTSLGFGGGSDSGGEFIESQTDQEGFWLVGGMIRSSEPMQNPQVTIEEWGLVIEVEPNGGYRLGRLRTGDYTLVFTDIDREPVEYVITVPSDNYSFDV